MIGVGLVTDTQCTLTLTAHVYHEGTAHVYHGGRECESGDLRANIYIKVWGIVWECNLFPIFSNISTLALIRLRFFN